ncbi:pantoate--beta-alanine ligase [Sulfurospirillum barnesii]|uniref:Pantothenate synthetase n=1 Tax=Sulfurospirillum barnesii (strain ATCC 700032 / DSM 10660 / SES-3) TaxID=760154 RepID=I3XV25_SULBS|nr:pantoate--beta-alanine ligase [Sulfurospirillum barnesii]AFL67799.1 pantothenate synthetase [Sulfurospirillum barnesii SES-3]
MKIVKTILELQDARKELHGSVGFVPTMGALHNGHLSLIQKSLAQNDHTIVSVFVNPTQFLAGEDFEKYPKRTQADIKICELAGVDVLFMPTQEVMYSKIEPTLLAPAPKAYSLEGLARPGHFDGVLRVVLKLFNLSKPSRAYFGKKDAQQLYLIQNMVQSLFLNIEIIPCDIVREDDGLALSSRNVYLSEHERQEALLLSKSLKVASRAIMAKERDCERIKAEMRTSLKPLHVEYVEILNRDFDTIPTIELGNCIILVCAKVGTTRLIDNLWI